MAPSNFPPVGNSPSTESISTAQCDYILKNYRQEDVIHALMTHLREREAELTKLTEQRSVALKQHLAAEQTIRKLKSAVATQRTSLEAKEERIANLERSLAQKDNGSEATDAMVKQLNDRVKSLTEKRNASNAENKRLLQERDAEISNLHSKIKNLRHQAKENAKKVSLQQSERLESKCQKLQSQLDAAAEKNSDLTAQIDQLEKKIKGKEWMIKSLQEENEDQRSRESHLLVHIRALKETIESYETQFVGKGVDVPMLLAKLKDSEERNTELGKKVQHLETEITKLGELATRVSPSQRFAPVRDGECNEDGGSMAVPGASRQREQEGGSNCNASVASSASFFANSFEQDEEEEATLNTNLSDMDDPFSKSNHDDDVLKELIQDVQVGIESLRTEGLCMGGYCADGGTESIEDSRVNVSKRKK